MRCRPQPARFGHGNRRAKFIRNRWWASWEKWIPSSLCVVEAGRERIVLGSYGAHATFFRRVMEFSGYPGCCSAPLAGTGARRYSWPASRSHSPCREKGFAARTHGQALARTLLDQLRKFR